MYYLRWTCTSQKGFKNGKLQKVKYVSPFVGEDTEDVKWELTRWGE